MYDVTYTSKEEAKADWYTLPQKYRTKQRLDEMLERVSGRPIPAVSNGMRATTQGDRT